MSRVTPVIQEDARRVVEQMPDLRRLAGSTVLITGAAGFLCSHLLDTFAALNETIAEPVHVIALDSFLTGVPDRLEHLAADPNFELVQHDVTLPYPAADAPDFIIHGASVASPTYYRRFPLETIDVNVNGTRQMLDLAQRGARSMLQLSTSEIYGDPDASNIPTAEDYRGFVSCTGPRACYDESKRLGETLCATYHRLFGTPVKTVRLFNVYGPGQRLDDKRIIPDLMSAAVEGRAASLFSDGRATRSFCYVTDAIRGMLTVLLSDANGEAFNVGNDQEEVTIRDVAAIVGDLAGIEVRLETSSDADYTTDNPRRRCPDLTKLRRLGSWTPLVDLRSGLGRTLESYRCLIPA